MKIKPFSYKMPIMAYRRFPPLLWRLFFGPSTAYSISHNFRARQEEVCQTVHLSFLRRQCPLPAFDVYLFFRFRQQRTKAANVTYTFYHKNQLLSLSFLLVHASTNMSISAIITSFMYFILSISHRPFHIRGICSLRFPQG